MRFNNLQRMNKIGRQRPLWNLVSKRTFRLDPQQYTKLLGDSINPDTREEFWGQAANELEWFKPFEQTLDNSNAPFTKWFKGGQLNVCYNAVDRWVEQGQGGQVAIYYDSPLSDTKKAYTFAELQDQVARFAGVLSQGGVQKGDRVVIYMPMIPEAVVAMLACARLGAVHSVVFGGFAAKELAVRIDDAKPKAVVSASFGIEPSRLVQYAPLLQGALEIAQHKPASVYVKHRQVPEKYAKEVIPVESSSIKDWDTEMDNATPHDAVPVLSTDPLYLLYTSGTTGQPKGVLRDSGGYATALKWSMEHFFDIKEKETFWAASDIGWVVGHSYIVYGPLLHGCSTVLYEGKPIFPDAGAFWRVISEYGVNGFFTAPTALRAIRKVDPELKLAANYDLSTLRATFLAGERADPETVKYFSKTLDKPIVDNYWQTELGWPALGYQIDGVGVKPGSASRALPGFDMHVLDEKTSEELEDDNLGDVGIKSPLPPGSFTTLYNADHRFKQAYFEKHKGYYMTGDAGIRDADGYFHIMARTDDVINCAGHRLSSGGMEEVLISHPDVAECAVIGAYCPDKTQIPVGCVVLKDGTTKTPQEVENDVISMVREEIGPVAFFKSAFVVEQLPKTRSGKILRGIMHNIADRQRYSVPGTIEDMSAIDHLEQVFAERWHPDHPVKA